MLKHYNSIDSVPFLLTPQQRVKELKNECPDYYQYEFEQFWTQLFAIPEVDPENAINELEEFVRMAKALYNFYKPNLNKKSLGFPQKTPSLKKYYDYNRSAFATYFSI